MAGEIVSITMNLSALVAAKYYDPASGTVKDAGSDVPMSRVTGFTLSKEECWCPDPTTP